MSHKKLSQVLEMIINGEEEAATALLHTAIVDIGKKVFESLEEEDYDYEDEYEDEDGLGGDVTNDFADDIAQDEEELDREDDFDGEDVEGEIEDTPVEDRIDSLEDVVAALRAEFDELMAEEQEEEDHDFDDEEVEDIDSDDEEVENEEEVADEEYEDYDDESEEDELQEATNFSKDVSIDMSREGKLVGTGKNSKTGSVETKSMYTSAPTKVLPGAKPVKFSKAAGEGNHPEKTAKSAGKYPVQNSDQKPRSAEMKGEGKTVGTGKNSPKGAVNAKAPLSKKPR